MTSPPHGKRDTVRGGRTANETPTAPPRRFARAAVLGVPAARRPCTRSHRVYLALVVRCSRRRGLFILPALAQPPLSVSHASSGPGSGRGDTAGAQISVLCLPRPPRDAAWRRRRRWRPSCRAPAGPCLPYLRARSSSHQWLCPRRHLQCKLRSNIGRRPHAADGRGPKPADSDWQSSK